jgi:hypothetical protein
LFEKEADLQEKLEAVQEENVMLRTELVRYKGKVDLLQEQKAGKSRDKSEKSYKLPDLFKFKGDSTDKPYFDVWLSKIRRKLKANKDHFKTPELCIAYVEGQVEGDVYDYLVARLLLTSPLL